MNKDQAWFWTKRWREGEREADEDVRAGRVHESENVDEGIAFLRKRAGEYDRKQQDQAHP